jgi:hypothetical protein
LLAAQSRKSLPHFSDVKLGTHDGIGKCQWLFSRHAVGNMTVVLCAASTLQALSI